MTSRSLNVSRARLWRLSLDRRIVRLQFPPLRIPGQKEPLDIHLDFEAEAVDEILQRLTELRAQMLPPPVRQ